MFKMGKYCKAYLAKDFRTYPHWTESLDNLRRETEFKDGEEVEIPREVLDDEDILYLQETYVVTDGILLDEYVIFDDVTDEWKEFCHKDLEFEIKPAEEAEDD